MANKNGFFQVLLKSGKTILRLQPPMDGGEPISLNEVKAYFDQNKIVPDDLGYMSALSVLTEPTDVVINQTAGYPIREYFSFVLSEDRMTAIARFYPPSDNGELIDKSEILNDLQHKGVKVPVDEGAIDNFLRNRQYCTNYVVARGVDAIQGAHAKIDYFFNTDPNTKPALNEDGSVDFFNLQTISKCEAGQVLATLTPEVQGRKGMRVTGEPVLPRDVRTAKLKYGNKISLSEDGLSLISDVNGHVSLIDGKVFVNDVYEVVDVDTSTGNIEYTGDLLVKGNVKAGFKVNVQGNVEVKGVVEGAEIKATGNVVMAKGCNGMGKGVIEATGNVIAKFIENATVVSGGYIHAEAVMHSKLQATGDVEVTGKRGFIVGGSVKSLGNVSAKTIGSEMGGDTIIDVGVDPKLKLQSNALAETIKKTKENIDKLVPVLATLTTKMKQGQQLTVDQMRYLKQLTEQYKIEKVTFDKANAEYDALQEEIDNMPTESYVAVSGNVFPGTMLTINEVSTTIKTTCTHSRFVRDGADVRIKPL